MNKNSNPTLRVVAQPPQEAFVAYANPLGSLSAPITLIRPSVIYSAASYSTPLALPIGIAYIAAAIRRANYNVHAIDCVAQGINQIRLTDDGKFKVQGITVDEVISQMDPSSDIVGITIMFSQEWPHIKKFITKLRKAFPKSTFVLGGEHVTAMAEFSLRDCPEIDYIVKGEGELTFLQLCYQLRKGLNVDQLGGIAFLKDGNLVENALAPRIAKVDQMPWPAWDCFNLEPYFQPNFTMGISQGRNMAMIATRGCPYQCTFCSNPTMWTTRYVMRGPKEVVDEIVHNQKVYQANSIDFYDLTAIVKKSWIIEFAEELKRREVRISWQLPSGTRSEVLDEEVISKIAQTGLHFLVYAPESGSMRVLEEIKKRVNLNKMTASIVIALRHQLVVKVNFIIGFPNEQRSDVLKTLFYIIKLAFIGVDDCNVALFSPYPGSAIYDDLRREGVIAKTDDNYFENLMTQFDFTLSQTFCKNIKSSELLVYRVFGMAAFYAISYLRKPSRILRLLKYFLSRHEPFQPRSLFEQRIFDFVTRNQNKKAA